MASFHNIMLNRKNTFAKVPVLYQNISILKLLFIPSLRHTRCYFANPQPLHYNSIEGMQRNELDLTEKNLKRIACE